MIKSVLDRLARWWLGSAAPEPTPEPTPEKTAPERDDTFSVRRPRWQRWYYVVSTETGEVHGKFALFSEAVQRCLELNRGKR